MAFRSIDARCSRRFPWIIVSSPRTWAKERERERWEKESDGQRGREAERQRERWEREKKKDRKTERQRGRETGRGESVSGL